MNKQIVTLDQFTSLLNDIVKKIQADNIFYPDTILALSTGGFPVAAAIAKRLAIKSRNVVGIPVYKDEKEFLEKSLKNINEHKGIVLLACIGYVQKVGLSRIWSPASRI